MKPNKTKIESIDDYINQFPDNIKLKLESIRAAIKKSAPKAKEVMSYGMPAFKINKVLVYFAAYKNHIGFYPTANPIKIFGEELKNYRKSKGAVQFQYEKKIPIALVSKITKFRVKEDLKQQNTQNKSMV